MNIISIVDNVNRNNQTTSNELKKKHEPVVAHEKREPSENEIRGAVESLNNSVENHYPQVSFSYHEKTKQVIVKVLDNETNEVIRQIPAKHVIRLQESIQEYLGLLIDKSI